MTAAGPPRDPRQRLGRDGESAAEGLLRRSGLVVLERRYRCRHGEIDLVARQGKLIVFVEVKTRRGASCGMPAESVTRPKRRRIAWVALDFLTRRGLLDHPSRFDVVEVLAPPGGYRELRHIVDAFRLDPAEHGFERL